MGGKTAIVGGLLTGMAVGGAMLAGVLLVAPAPAVPGASTQPSPTATVPATASSPASPPATATPPPSPAPSASASASASIAPPSAGASPGSPQPTSPVTGFGVGEPAPGLSVEQLGGGRIELANLRGKPVWVNFMATWCLPCRDELPLMAGFAARYADTGLVVLAIDVREDDSAVDAFMKGLGIELPVGLDGNGVAQQAWGAFALPVHFWIDGAGVVRDGALGGIGPDVMAAGLRSILPGVNVTP